MKDIQKYDGAREFEIERLFPIKIETREIIDKLQQEYAHGKKC